MRLCKSPLTRVLAFTCAACACAFASPSLLMAQEKSSLPDEIIATGGQGTGQSGAGAALISDQAAILINPAMLYRHKTYDVNGSYIWPVSGRPFYKVAAIDGQTSRFTTAFEYTGFTEGLEGREKREQDSPVRRRAALAVAVPLTSFSMGFAAHYVEADDPTREEEHSVKAFTLGFGLAIPLSTGITLGASLQNLNNKKVENVSPRTLRAGLAWQDKTGSLGLHADYRDRQRSEYLEDFDLTESNQLMALLPGETPKKLENEKMVIVGGQIQTMDAFRIFASTGRNAGGEKSEITSGGIGVFQKNFSLSYAVSRIYPNKKDLQNSLSLSITMKM